VKRRRFIAILGSAVAVWPVIVRAEELTSKLPRIGFIQNFRNENFVALTKGLREAGYIDGQNVVMEKRFHGAALDRIDQFASELVALKCKVIFAAAPYAIQALLKATNTIPIVGVDLESDPVAKGWVPSLARPGGNLTGLFLDIPDMAGKLIELLRDAIPTLSHLAVLWDETIGTVRVASSIGEHAGGASYNDNVGGERS
jgi:putative ABC transport system substrate-binding protein